MLLTMGVGILAVAAASNGNETKKEYTGKK